MAGREAITAIVTSCNEASLLPDALSGIAFCDEVIVVEVCSDGGDSAAVAERFGARFVRHVHMPIVEAVRSSVAPSARHDLLLLTDPDERIPPELARRVVELVHELRGTVWGGENKRRLLVRRSAVDLVPTIWSGIRLHDGYRILTLPFTAETAIEHRWAEGWRDLLVKHRRYLAQEAGDRAAAGEITGLRNVVRTPWSCFRESYFTKRGYRDGRTGLGLSLFWAAFRTAGEIRLLRRLRAGRP
jgi:hypothetical protein